MQFSRYGRAHLRLAPAVRRTVVHPGSVIRPVSHTDRPEVERDARSLRTQQCALHAPCVSHGSNPEGRTDETLAASCHVDVPSVSSRRPTYEADASPGQLESCQVLLRKEVIQPHLPVRLPCYDLVPIANPTLDVSLPEGLGRRLRVLPTFVT